MTLFLYYATVHPSTWENNYGRLMGKQHLMLPPVIWTLLLAEDVLISTAQQIEPLPEGTAITEKIRKETLLFIRLLKA